MYVNCHVVLRAPLGDVHGTLLVGVTPPCLADHWIPYRNAPVYSKDQPCTYNVLRSQDPTQATQVANVLPAPTANRHGAPVHSPKNPLPAPCAMRDTRGSLAFRLVLP